MSGRLVVYPAAAIHTFDRSVPTAPAVAVRDGHVVGVGSVDQLRAYGEPDVDERFADKVLVPGFIEAHSHAMAGGFWQFPYVGYFARTDPRGREWSGCRDVGEVVERLRAVESELDDPTEPLVAWGLDPIYFDGEQLLAAHLDRVSTTRPIFVMHASIHLATVNTALMAAEGIDRSSAVEGVVKDEHGDPVGELREPAAMSLASSAFRLLFARMGGSQALTDFAVLARNAGITTVTDLGSSALTSEGAAQRWRDATEGTAFPARAVVLHNPGFGGSGDLEADADEIVALRDTSTERLRFGLVKLILDGSIQGFTARLGPPGYHGGQPNGQWLIPPEQVADRLAPFHRAGLTVHAHCNGDESVDVFLDAVETVLRAAPRWDHRHTVQHSQLTSAAQYRRIRALGLCANIFANHVYYWGDQHVALTVGPDRAARMNAAATALAAGVPLSMHSDAAVTPLGSLHVAWCAVNRLTASGEVLGPGERISVGEALACITIGAAYQLRLDHELGSITPGKRADLAVLEADPHRVDPTELKDIPVWGTVVGGEPQPAV